MLEASEDGFVAAAMDSGLLDASTSSVSVTCALDLMVHSFEYTNIYYSFIFFDHLKSLAQTFTFRLSWCPC